MSVSKVFSVSTLNRCARQLLEEGLGTIWLQGELSNFVAASSGHWYFSIKDERSQVKGAMFRGANRKVSLQPRSGLQVLVKAQVSLYEPRGDYQIIVEMMEDAGEGLLKQKFEQLKMQLAAEGLFSTELKQPIPAHPLTVGVVTSPTGAALHDILTVMKRRNPSIRVIIYPTQVQGDTAPPQIAKAIALANQRDECDVLIVGRGGGSLEDLWAFNDEIVARTIHASHIPVISAVGHEIDTTIADYVADMRAPTPSAAAEYVSGDTSHQRQQLSQLAARLRLACARKVEKQQMHLTSLVQRLTQQHPAHQLQQQQQRADDLNARLMRAVSSVMSAKQLSASQLSMRLDKSQPGHRVAMLGQRQANLTARLQKSMQSLLSTQQQNWQQASHGLSLVSPLSTLGRGYTITKDHQTGQIIKRVEDVMPGQQLVSQLTDGQIISDVTEVLPSKQSKE
ncbi:exodeoxyribonuclease VII large subunit [Corallincola platygyrae]|uniref:Exodeoxyribonuclease 7 large subunit n=1 Tax=Corallincola platygyrae TaxID=1193278 RepID=A0ABW4XIL3_9GAMM